MVVATAIILSASLGCGKKTPVDDHTVANVELNRYTGKWYEIASLPAPFQSDCFCTTAEYALEDDHVKVINRCRRGSAKGEWYKAVGKAWPVKGSNNSRFEVSFFWPFKGDYWIIGLARDYSWAMVGHPQKKYLWILARKPHMSRELYESLISKARGLGYDVAGLKLMVQSCDR